MVMKKKGESSVFTIIIWGAILLITGFLVIAFFGRGFSRSTEFFDEKIEHFGGCDDDNVFNGDDRCPCLSSQGFFSEKVKLWGCPEETKTENEAADEKKRCTPQQCKKTEEKRKEAKEEEKKESKADITISRFGGTKNFQDGKYREDLQQKTESIVPLEVVISNIGEENVEKRIMVSVKVCNPQKILCIPKKMTVQGTSIGQDGLPIESLDKGRSQGLLFFIELGTEGDACDGAGARDCIIEISATSDLQEKEVKNNRKEINAILTSQQWVSSLFENIKTIHIKAQDDEPGTYPIHQLCKGYIGRSDLLGYCPAGDSCEGDFHSDESPGWKYHGCWAVISEKQELLGKEGISECGETLSPTGFVINQLEPTPIKREGQVGYYSDDDDKNPEKLLTPQFTWKATVEGSLLCSDNAESKIIRKGFEELKNDNWILFNPLVEGKIAKLVNDREFLCRNNQWYKR